VSVLLVGALLWMLVFVVLKVVPVIRRGRVVALDHPKPCSMAEAQHSLDRLVAAGFDAEIVEDDDNAINTWANVGGAAEVRPPGVTSSKFHGSKRSCKSNLRATYLLLGARRSASEQAACVDAPDRALCASSPRSAPCRPMVNPPRRRGQMCE